MEQAASDLEANRRRQRELAESIKLLEQEEALLVDILAVAARHEVSSEPPLPPEKTQDEPVLTPSEPAAEIPIADVPAAATPEKTSPTASGKAKGKRADKKPAKSGAKGNAKGKPLQPPLGDVLCDLLRAHDEPRYAKELRDELLEKHPDRNPTAQVVRNTLETLVAKGRIQRHKQQRSVLYTIV
ncbi:MULTISPECIES: hypothetical protein [Actinomadura]|uniref:BlaI/MecI/CopY family transcriptional regulator n=1 Tax=Actinomadura yumaensis TaxID=111807 RepID=A0ABW2CHT0_9ACTN|nr:hypothetical protein [Actinomadura sp. J1-007]MWK37001.1 hypothetical protein [Actinomadura sp. J1-007]